MKFLTIAMFVLVINVAMAVMNEVGVFDDAYNKAPSETWLDDLSREELRDEQYIQSQVEGDTGGFGFGDFLAMLKSLVYFTGVVVKGVVVIPYTLTQLGLSSTMAALISVPMYATYLLGLAEFIGGRQTRGMY